MSKFKITKSLSGLSLIELITLQKLIDHKGPVVRFILYQEINQFINPNRNNGNTEEYYTEIIQVTNLSTSSFYNSLKSLEATGFVSFIKRKQKGKNLVIAVEATEKAKLAIKGIMGQLFSMTIEDVDFMVKVFGELMKIIGSSNFSNILVVNLMEHIDNRLMGFAFKMVDNVFLLANMGIYESMLKMGFDKLKSTVMFNNVIREPKDIFDIAFIPEYERKPKFFGLSRIDMLKELIRVVKQGGQVIIIGRSSIPQIDNFYAKELLNKYEESILGRIFTEEELKEDLKSAGFNKYEVYDFKGVIVGLGWV